MFSKQDFFCCICAMPFKGRAGPQFNGIDVGGLEEGVCSTDCLREKGWRRTLSIMGSDYHPKKETA